MRIVKELVEIWPNKVCDTIVRNRIETDKSETEI